VKKYTLLFLNRRILEIASITLILALYVGFAFVALRQSSGPVDYETFMRIGRAFVEKRPVYMENSFYPMPYVGIFSLFYRLPFVTSYLVWVFLPVILALFISNFSPLILLFAPLFSHFTGGQSAIFGMLGLWGYRKNQKSIWGGIWLSILLLKPQLAIAPLIWAGWSWVKEFKARKKVPKQMIVFLTAAMLIYLPWFLYNNAWLGEWISNPRSLRLRAMAGLIPRLLMYLDLPLLSFYAILLVITVIICYWVYRKKAFNLDIVVLLSFILLPFVHDYDLIQIIPLLDNAERRKFAVISSIPLWLTIFLAYRNDDAWITAALIAPSIFWFIWREINPKMTKKSLATID